MLNINRKYKENFNGRYGRMCSVSNVRSGLEHGAWLEFVTGRMGPKKHGPPTLFPAPPRSKAWGGVSFAAFPATVPAQAAAPLIPQTGLR